MSQTLLKSKRLWPQMPSVNSSPADRGQILSDYLFDFLNLRDDGNVRFTFAQPKQTLDIYRILCAGKAEPHEALCTLFDDETSHGRDMAVYSELLQKAVASIVHTFSRRAVGQLLLSRDAILPTRREQATEDSEFELVTWLVIKEARA